MLLILGGNPVYTAPADLDVRRGAGRRSALRVHLGLYDDETAQLCHWHVPEAHYLESWGDARAFDGTVSIVQPLIAPLYGGKTAHELLGRCSATGRTPPATTSSASTGSGQLAGGGLRAGLADASCTTASCRTRRCRRSAVAVDGGAAQAARAMLPTSQARAPSGRSSSSSAPTPRVCDGRFANNGWLQELPKPLTKLTWDNAALLAPGDGRAARRSTPSDDASSVDASGGRKIEAAGLDRCPGRPTTSVTLHLGYGRDARRQASATGVRLQRLRAAHRATPCGPRAASTIRSTGERYTARLHPEPPRARWQRHEDRGAARRSARRVIRSGTRRSSSGRRTVMQKHREPPRHDDPLPAVRLRRAHAWGMAIDLNACIGCNACVVACQAENNIPVVGKDQVAARPRDALAAHRPLLRRRRSTTPRSYFQPVPCMHCENAPCEVVCPVDATVHSAEGLNDMVYNRCVGTRYCSNNCPYKVRRFNFLQYTDYDTPSAQAAAQPRRHGPQPRRDGEVHLLRAAHQRRRGSTAEKRGPRRSATARS